MDVKGYANELLCLVSLKCVSATSGTCTPLAPGLVLAVRGNQVAAALFDVEGCFEALSEQRSEGRTAPTPPPTPPFLATRTETDNPICHGHKYTHAIKIHLCAFMSVRACSGVGTRSGSRGMFFSSETQSSDLHDFHPPRFQLPFFAK